MLAIACVYWSRSRAKNSGVSKETVEFSGKLIRIVAVSPVSKWPIEKNGKALSIV